MPWYRPPPSADGSRSPAPRPEKYYSLENLRKLAALGGIAASVEEVVRLETSLTAAIEAFRERKPLGLQDDYGRPISVERAMRWDSRTDGRLGISTADVEEAKQEIGAKGLSKERTEDARIRLYVFDLIDTWRALTNSEPMTYRDGAFVKFALLAATPLNLCEGFHPSTIERHMSLYYKKKRL